MPAIDIDRDAAHEAAQRELSKPIYPKHSLTQEIFAKITEFLFRVLQRTSSVPGGWFTVTVLSILVAAGVAAAIYVARRTIRTKRGGDYELFDAGRRPQRNTEPPRKALRPKEIGPQRYGIGCARWPANSKRPGCSPRFPAAPPTNWLPTPPRRSPPVGRIIAGGNRFQRRDLR